MVNAKQLGRSPDHFCLYPQCIRTATKSPFENLSLQEWDRGICLYMFSIIVASEHVRFLLRTQRVKAQTRNHLYTERFQPPQKSCMWFDEADVLTLGMRSDHFSGALCLYVVNFHCDLIAWLAGYQITLVFLSRKSLSLAASHAK